MKKIINTVSIPYQYRVRAVSEPCLLRTSSVSYRAEQLRSWYGDDTEQIKKEIRVIRVICI
ncbi:hypothetical protein [Bacteroides sp. UBA939]|uniref:hypothetical protein n=1 Tax=Bacteroides sp. UBA939 TaxID=1946092 RepID=UPI0025BF36D2|nr:hypothetical protein [Bacteroides sp. UBA939]